MPFRERKPPEIHHVFEWPDLHMVFLHKRNQSPTRCTRQFHLIEGPVHPPHAQKSIDARSTYYGQSVYVKNLDHDNKRPHAASKCENRSTKSETNSKLKFFNVQNGGLSGKKTRLLYHDFCHLDFDHLILFRASDFDIRIFISFSGCRRSQRFCGPTCLGYSPGYISSFSCL